LLTAVIIMLTLIAVFLVIHGWLPRRYH